MCQAAGMHWLAHHHGYLHRGGGGGGGGGEEMDEPGWMVDFEDELGDEGAQR